MSYSLVPYEGKNKTRFQEFKERIFKFYQWRWNQECPWDGSEANQLSRLLGSCPKLEISEFSRWLFNYGNSEDIKPGERPRKFLPRIHDYSVTALDRFGRDQNAKTGETFAERDASNTIASARRALENLRRTGNSVPSLASPDEHRMDGTILPGRKRLSASSD